jgi:hypothetical protein
MLTQSTEGRAVWFRVRDVCEPQLYSALLEIYGAVVLKGVVVAETRSSVFRDPASPEQSPEICVVLRVDGVKDLLVIPRRQLLDEDSNQPQSGVLTRI